MNIFDNRARILWGRENNTYQWYLFRKEFLCEKAGEVWLTVSAGDDCLVYLNGQLLCRHPTRSFDYERSYNRMEVERFLRQGENVLVIISCKMKNYGVIAQIEQNNRVIMVTDTTWKAAPHPCFAMDGICNAVPLEPMRHMEEQYDARKEKNWLEVGFDDQLWESAIAVDGRPGVPTGFTEQPGQLLSNDFILPKRVLMSRWSRRQEGYYFRFEGVNLIRKKFYITEVAAGQDCIAKVHGCGRMMVNGTAVQDALPLRQGKNLLILCSGFGEMEFVIQTKAGLEFSQWWLIEEENHGIPHSWSTPVNEEEGSSWMEERLSALSCFDEIPQEYRAAMRPIANKETSVAFSMEHRDYWEGEGCYACGNIDRSVGTCEEKEPIQNVDYMLHSGCQYACLTPSGHRQNTFLLDFGDLYLGYVELTVKASAGTVIEAVGFEVIDDNGIAWMGNNSFRYICKEGWQTFTSVLPRGFRYLMVAVESKQSFTLVDTIGLRHAACPIQKTGTFYCPDQRLNQIFSMSVKTAELCMKDTYVDCPGYEQVYWVGDAMITALVNMTCFGQYNYDQYCIDLTGDSLSDRFYERYREDYKGCENGHYLTMCAFSDFARGGIPMWSFLWVWQCRNHYLYSGDRKGLEKNYQYVIKLADNCERFKNDRGLLEIEGTWNLIDWANNDLPAYGEVTSNTAWYAFTCRTAAYFARELGMDGEGYERKAQEAAIAMQKYCWKESAGGYVDTVRDSYAYTRYVSYCNKMGYKPLTEERYRNAERVSQQTNTIAYLCGCVPENRLEQVTNIIRLAVSEPRVVGTPLNVGYDKPENGIVPVGTPFFRFFTLEAFFRMGEAETAINLIKKEWGEMLDKGATTCWETFLKEGKRWTRSVCHAWSASPAVFALTNILGIRPLEPGFEKFTVAPMCGAYPDMNGSIATPYGPIFVSVVQGKVSVTAPAKCQLVDEK